MPWEIEDRLWLAEVDVFVEDIRADDAAADDAVQRMRRSEPGVHSSATTQDAHQMWRTRFDRRRRHRTVRRAGDR